MKSKLVLGVLKSVARLPLGILYAVSDFAYFVIYHLAGYRRKVVRRNLSEAFPDKSQKEIKKRLPTKATANFFASNQIVILIHHRRIQTGVQKRISFSLYPLPQA